METEDNPKIIYQRSLDNLGVSFEPIFINKSLEDGLADLVKIAQEEEHEAAWLYVPYFGEWHNLALKKIKPDEVIAYYGVTGEGIIEREWPDFGDIKKTHYHTHPKSFIENELRKVLTKTRELNPDLPERIMSTVEILQRKIMYTVLSLPSYGDMDSYIDFAVNHGMDNTDFCVVSPHFIVQTVIDPNSISANAEEEYLAIYQIISPAIAKEKGRASLDMPIAELAKETCRRINSQIPGLSISIREHQGTGK